MTIISIDPDCELSGVATYENGVYGIGRQSFWDIAEYIRAKRPDIVLIECGYLNKAIFNARGAKNGAIAAAIGRQVGRNEEIARQLVAFCVRHEQPHIEIRPTQEKVAAAEFREITGITKRTNQDERDAAMLIARHLKKGVIFAPKLF